MDIENEKEIDLEFEDSEESLNDKLKQLREKLKTCEHEKLDYLTSWQKERADFQNFKKDEEKRITDRVSFAKEKFVLEFLTVLDSFDMAMANKIAWESVDKNWRTGIEYIYQQFLQVLDRHGVTKMQIKEGDIFDANLAQSVETVVTAENEKDHVVAAVLQSGYKSSDRVLRPARVKVFAVFSK